MRFICLARISMQSKDCMHGVISLLQWREVYAYMVRET
jgi:hypothetical protein